MREPAPTAIDPIDVKRALAALDPGEGPSKHKTRALLVALAVGDTYAEIAERTGQSEVAVRKSAERARKTEASRLRARGRHDIGIRNLMIAAGLLAVFAVFFGPSERRHMVQQTIASWIHPPKPLDVMPKDVTPSPTPDPDPLDDAEEALRQGDFERCNADMQAARFHGSADRGRLQDLTQRCLALGERNAPAPSALPRAPRAPAPDAPFRTMS